MFQLWSGGKQSRQMLLVTAGKSPYLCGVSMVFMVFPDFPISDFPKCEEFPVPVQILWVHAPPPEMLQTLDAPLALPLRLNHVEPC